MTTNTTTITITVNAISKTNFHFPGQKNLYKGKVRDVYNINDTFLIMITTDRISAFDVILPKPIPYKGQCLNQIAAKFLKETKYIVPNWVIEVVDPNVTIGINCKPYPVEMVIRGYLSGHAWREYKSGKRMLCGTKLPDGMKENDPFPEPIITPSTKASTGHDEDITPQTIIEKGLVPESEYKQLEHYTKELFNYGTKYAHKKGLILVDTKYEFGKTNNQIYLIDEIHTPDSSRYFYFDGYEERQKKSLPQKQLSKEFVREWLMEHGFQGKSGQVIPELSDQFINSVSERYIELFENITGEKFVKLYSNDVLDRIETNINKFLKLNKTNA